MRLKIFSSVDEGFQGQMPLGLEAFSAWHQDQPGSHTIPRQAHAFHNQACVT